MQVKTSKSNVTAPLLKSAQLLVKKVRKVTPVQQVRKVILVQQVRKVIPVQQVRKVIPVLKVLTVKML